MISGHIAGATRVLGKSQGYIGLSIRDERMDCQPDGPNTPVMTSAWFPTPDEIAAIAAGTPVYLRIVGTAHPPVMLYAGTEGEEPANE